MKDKQLRISLEKAGVIFADCATIRSNFDRTMADDCTITKRELRRVYQDLHQRFEALCGYLDVKVQKYDAGVQVVENE